MATLLTFNNLAYFLHFLMKLPLLLLLQFFFLGNFLLYSQQENTKTDLLLKHNKKWKMSRFSNGTEITLNLDETYNNTQIKGVFTHAYDSVIYVDSIGFHLRNILLIKGKASHAKKFGKEDMLLGGGQIAGFGLMYLVINVSQNSFVQLSAFTLMVPLLVSGFYYLYKGVTGYFFVKRYPLDKYRIEFDEKRMPGSRKKKLHTST